MIGDPVVTVTGLPADGQVVRWYLTAADTACPDHAPLTATRRGVTVTGYLTDLPAGWVDAARRAHHTLRGRPYADLSGMATHRHDPAGGPAAPVDPLRRT